MESMSGEESEQEDSAKESVREHSCLSNSSEEQAMPRPKETSTALKILDLKIEPKLKS